MPPENFPLEIILWVFFISNFIFIEVFVRKLKLISVNIFWF